MILRVLLITCALLAGCSTSHSPNTTPDAASTIATPAPTPTRSPEDILAASEPSESHKILKQMSGTFKQKVSYWGLPTEAVQGENPSTEPQVMYGRSINTLGFGERFLIQKVYGGTKKSPFEGLGVVGFDNVRKQFVSIWIENTSTGMTSASGIYDATSKTIIESGVMSDPVSGSSVVPFRGVTQLLDKDHYQYEMFVRSTDGKESKIMLIEFSRVS